MPIKIKTDLEFGDVFYMKNDPDQTEHLLVGIIICPGNQFKFQLSYLGDVCTVWDFETSRTRDQNKIMDIPVKEDDD
jgi:hypothetical protein